MSDMAKAKLLIKAFFELCRLYVGKYGKVKKESNALHGTMVFLDAKRDPLNEGVGAIEQQYKTCPGRIQVRAAIRLYRHKDSTYMYIPCSTASIGFIMKITRQYQFAKNVLEKANWQGSNNYKRHKGLL
ncbi:hypothetical protein CU097_006926 [Rhizopus azygosporus]|uniref:Uncharacterized protein n=1 Tax=Rhizopus azygosporus TaxID=86630 RepID=A0A367J668_RHIAZ|nr:hypothetical protein CU097_006926 [Rhizopus azygosporus]